MKTLVMIRIEGDEDTDAADIRISDRAAAAVRFKFNPSGLDAVNNLKALAAAFITVCDEVAAVSPEAGRDLSVAKTNMETAAMWAVKGATTGL